MPATVCSYKTNVLCEQLLTFNYIKTTGKLPEMHNHKTAVFRFAGKNRPTALIIDIICLSVTQMLYICG